MKRAGSPRLGSVQEREFRMSGKNPDGNGTEDIRWKRKERRERREERRRSDVGFGQLPWHVGTTRLDILVAKTVDSGIAVCSHPIKSRIFLSVIFHMWITRVMYVCVRVRVYVILNTRSEPGYTFARSLFRLLSNPRTCSDSVTLRRHSRGTHVSMSTIACPMQAC